MYLYLYAYNNLSLDHDFGARLLFIFMGRIPESQFPDRKFSNFSNLRREIVDSRFTAQKLAVCQFIEKFRNSFRFEDGLRENTKLSNSAGIKFNG